MTEDHEQDQPEARDTTARPANAAARRERRAAMRGETPARPAEDKVPTGTRSRRKAAADGEASTKAVAATKTLSKEDQGITTPRRGQREKQPSLIARFSRFIREVVSELRKVIWPTRRQQITYTVVVLVFVSVVVAFVSGLDLGFAKLVFWIFA